MNLLKLPNNIIINLDNVIYIALETSSIYFRFDDKNVKAFHCENSEVALNYYNQIPITKELLGDFI